ncbi:MAG: hypothetical protein AAGI91_10875 [Bacteroidota bacterium]
MTRRAPRARWARYVLPIVLGALLFPLAAAPAAAQSFDLYGFIKSAYYYDTQQVVGAREGDFLLYPALATDADDEPNDTDNLLFFPFFSRVGVTVGDLPEALGATVSGRIEGDFFGPGNPNNNTFRIRRATVGLDWGDREAMFGMEWTPFFLSSWARTVATEAGAPFNPFARHVMARVTFKPGNARVSGILAQQRDAFQEIGGLRQQQQAALPSATLSAEYGSGGNTVGATALVKWIRPELTSERFTSGAVQGFAALARPRFVARANVTYGGDLADHLMTGGYAIVPGDGGEVEFEPLDVVAAWAEVETTGTLSLGLFGGFLQNLGTSASGLDPDAVTFAARGYGETSAIEHVWRVAPRLVYNAGALRFGFEVQATGARYVVGADQSAVYDGSLAPSGDTTEDVVNLRGNFTVFLFF